MCGARHLVVGTRALHDTGAGWRSMQWWYEQITIGAVPGRHRPRYLAHAR
jgi:hypothetical protein